MPVFAEDQSDYVRGAMNVRRARTLLQSGDEVRVETALTQRGEQQHGVVLHGIGIAPSGSTFATEAAYK
jgi:hypothetical protein